MRKHTGKRKPKPNNKKHNRKRAKTKRAKTKRTHGAPHRKKQIQMRKHTQNRN